MFLENDLTNEGVSLSFPSLPSHHDIRQTAICSVDAVVPLCITEGKESTGMAGEVLEEKSQMADHGPRSPRPSYQAQSDLSGVGNGLEGDSLQLGECSWHSSVICVWSPPFTRFAYPQGIVPSVQGKQPNTTCFTRVL